ncbi:DNA ligase [Sphingomonas phage Scott]|uniref:DNA ligase n=1 Tax=Sphingomonas phage Scott TaxID=2282912 RepID=A0A346FDD3_9CAUD|nr:DNA ligase [Sphingomonas phage Scott]AXN53747.1 DNA ligase [Sphingomonas phage Scott]
MAKDYIIQKAVEIGKVVKKNRLTLEEYGQRFSAWRKYDGCCAILKDGSTFSRTGEEYRCLDSVARFLRELYPNLVFIGEAWWGGRNQFNLISGAFRRLEENDRLQFIVHDVLPRSAFDAGYCPIPFKDREHELIDGGALDGALNRIYLAQGWAAGTYGDPQAKCNELVYEGGYDGLILRNPDGHWTVGSGTTGEIVKIKRKLSFDLEVLEVNTAVGEKTGRTVYTLVVDFKGQRLGVGSGVPHKLADVPTVGSIVEVEAMDYSSDGLLREPRYKGTRFDKLSPDR